MTDFEELGGDFMQEEGWASVCCRTGSPQDLSIKFTVDFTTMYYPQAINAKGFFALVHAHGAQAKLDACASSVPKEYASLPLPSAKPARAFWPR